MDDSAGRAEPYWAGWGPPGAHPLAPRALRALERRLGTVLPVTPPVAAGDVRLAASRLDADDVAALTAVVGAPYVCTDRDSRLLRAGGRSYVDLLRRRAGGQVTGPDAVVLPGDPETVQRLLGVCAERGIAVVPYGGGTSVVGGVEPEPGGHRAVVTVDLRRLDRLVCVDETSLLAVVQAGMRGPDLERALTRHGLTLGHVPQSFEFATVGGYAATRSAGQASTGVGRFDELVHAVRVATPAAEWRLGRAPASAAGPDLRALVLGSEGTLGIVTEVTLRVRPLPERVRYAAWALPSFAAGCAALRRLEHEGAAGDVSRLSDETETEMALTLAGVHGPRALALRGYLRARGVARPCLLVLGFEASARSVRRRSGDARRLLRAAGGVPLGQAPALAWRRGRFAGPYQRDALLDRGVLAETLETAATWSRLGDVYDGVRTALGTQLTAGRHRPVIMCHVSHVYPTGASLYFTVLAVRRPGDEERQWLAAKRAATDAITRAGATITHHHAVGTDHADWLTAEIGEIGVEVLRAVKQRLDPAGVLNPGKLIPAPGGRDAR